MNLKFALALVGVATSSCANAPREITFDRTQNAMIVVAGPPGLSHNIDEFRKVDLSKNEFISGYLRIESQRPLFEAKPNELNAGVPDRPVVLAAQEVPAGDYARQQSTRIADTNVYYGHVGTLCLSAFAPVYSLAPGEIAVIRVDQVAVNNGQWRSPANAPSDSQVMDEFNRSQPNFPGLAGQASLKEPVAFVRWESNGRQCLVPKYFERINAPPTH